MFTSVADYGAKISEEYARLGHTLGWRFLYTPARSLHEGNKLAFIGLNPGGSQFELPAPSVESGNAYRVERWGPNGTLRSLQVQVKGLYLGVGHVLGADADQMMDATLAANYCPFRSPSWDLLPRKAESMAFSRRLWFQILEQVRPTVIVCLGDPPAQQIAELLSDRNTSLIREERIPIGWGNVTYSEFRFGRTNQWPVLIRLPHLSRYAFIGRPKSADATRRLCVTIAEGLR